MNYRALHRRLDEIKAKVDAIERERTRIELEQTLSKEELAERAKQTYRQIMTPVPRSEGSRKPSLEETMEMYLRMVREPAPTPKKKHACMTFRTGRSHL